MMVWRNALKSSNERPEMALAVQKWLAETNRSRLESPRTDDVEPLFSFSPHAPVFVVYDIQPRFSFNPDATTFVPRATFMCNLGNDPDTNGQGNACREFVSSSTESAHYVTPMEWLGGPEITSDSD